MSDQDTCINILKHWSGAAIIDETSRLSDLWDMQHGSTFRMEGARELIAKLLQAFGSRPDKRRVHFLKTSDFSGSGLRISRVIDLLHFVLDATEDRVIKVLEHWSGVAEIEDLTATICSLWARAHNTGCEIGTDALIPPLADEFRELRITLRNSDFGSNGQIQTIDDLINAIAQSPSKQLEAGR
jgi:hypothetical protein